MSPLVAFAFEVSEDGPWVHIELASGLGPIAVMQRQRTVYVVSLPNLTGVSEREQRLQGAGPQVEVVRAYDTAVREDDGLLDTVVELSDVAGPPPPLQSLNGFGREGD